MNDILYHFQKWDDNLTTSSRDIYPSAHKTYKAIYKGSPLFDEYEPHGNLRNLTITPSVPQGYIKLTWSEHPNTNVTEYHIYRHYKKGSYRSDPSLIATRNRGTLQYIDVNYEVDTDGDYQLFYDVKAYYEPDQTISSPNPVFIQGEATNIASKIGSNEEITYYDISNYPNPYNPQTTIRFQLPQEGFVTIKVYNSLGEEIKTLLNEKKDYGRYELKFDGSDLPSGMYIYTIKVNDYYASKKMLLVK
jgi:5-hydroxyisourate hydrolase-like protein (transthyretin family)